MHQQPPKTPLLCSTRAANAAHVDSSRAVTVYVSSSMKPSLTRWDARLADWPVKCPVPGARRPAWASVQECPLRCRRDSER